MWPIFALTFKKCLKDMNVKKMTTTMSNLTKTLCSTYEYGLQKMKKEYINAGATIYLYDPSQYMI